MLGYHFEITSVNEQFWEKFVTLLILNLPTGSFRIILMD